MTRVTTTSLASAQKKSKRRTSTNSQKTVSNSPPSTPKPSADLHVPPSSPAHTPFVSPSQTISKINTPSSTPKKSPSPRSSNPSDTKPPASENGTSAKDQKPDGTPPPCQTLRDSITSSELHSSTAIPSTLKIHASAHNSSKIPPSSSKPFNPGITSPPSTPKKPSSSSVKINQLPSSSTSHTTCPTYHLEPHPNSKANPPMAPTATPSRKSTTPPAGSSTNSRS